MLGAGYPAERPASREKRLLRSIWGASLPRGERVFLSGPFGSPFAAHMDHMPAPRNSEFLTLFNRFPRCFVSNLADFLGDFDPGELDSRSLGQT